MGKVSFETITVPVEPLQGQQELTDPQEGARQAAQKMLQDGKGFDAWSNVTYRTLDNGKVYVAGTAYFPDLSLVQAPWMPTQTQWKKDVDGMVLSMLLDPTPQHPRPGGRRRPGGEQEQPATKPASLSQEELQKRILLQRMKYQQGRPMMVAMFGSMRMDVTWRLPRMLGKTGAFGKTDQGGVQFAFTGKDMLAAMDRAVADDELMVAAVRQDAEVQEMEAMRDLLMKQITGKSGQLRAKVRGELKPLFDYQAEMAAARKQQTEMFKKLKLQPPSPS